MSGNILTHIAARTRTSDSNVALGICLAFIAGAMNAGGFLAIGAYTSHMTGIVSSIGDLIVLNKWDLAGLAASYVLSFTAGAALCSLLIVYGREKKWHGEIAYPLLVEAALIAVIAFAQWPAPAIIALLCFVMGLQNAIITKISQAVIRTTHVTGIVTDIGIEAGRYLARGITGDNTVTPHPEKMKLHLALLAAFTVGGVTGAFAFLHTGSITALVLSAALVAMAAHPVKNDIKRLFSHAQD